MIYTVNGQKFEKKIVDGVEKIFDDQGKCLYIGHKGEIVEVVFSGTQPRLKVTFQQGKKTYSVLKSFQGNMVCFPKIEE